MAYQRIYQNKLRESFIFFNDCRLKFNALPYVSIIENWYLSVMHRQVRLKYLSDIFTLVLLWIFFLGEFLQMDKEFPNLVPFEKESARQCHSFLPLSLPYGHFHSMKMNQSIISNIMESDLRKTLVWCRAVTNASTAQLKSLIFTLYLNWLGTIHLYSLTP